jgi:hypothetical protein
VSRLPGRASSLASVGLLFALCVFGAVLGEQQSANRTQAVLPAARVTAKAVHQRAEQRGHEGPRPTATTTVPLVTENFRCPKPTGPDGVQRGTRPISSSQHGEVLLTDTFCRDSTWYVSARISGRISVVAVPFRVPDDPPVPTAVTADRFISLGGATLPAALVLREQFPGASLYELFTVVGRYVEPMVLSPGSSPVLLLKASYELQGAGFSCSDTGSGEVIDQYQWYVVNPTTLKTNARGDVIGDPEVFFETTEYNASSAHSFTATTLPIVTKGYSSAEKLSNTSC